MKKILLCPLLFMGACSHRDPEPLYLPELHRDPYQILTTDDTEELAKYGIYYNMDMIKT